MSTLVAQTISNGSVSTSSANVIQGSAKAWVNYNGATPAIRASYNVSSVTVNGTGDFTINFTNAFADANYSAVGMAGRTSSFGSIVEVYGAGAAPTTTALRILAGSGASAINLPYINVACFR